MVVVDNIWNKIIPRVDINMNRNRRNIVEISTMTHHHHPNLRKRNDFLLEDEKCTKWCSKIGAFDMASNLYCILHYALPSRVSYLFTQEFSVHFFAVSI
mmetsp:Transcript_3160/g.3659  ORF Transcript_3160/g.3659 Transcript_3160/m.3659 type:complete len:99 (+) Transcript_3160:323-619(+)